MYNLTTKTVTCDTCGAKVPAKPRRLKQVATDLEPPGWTYTGNGQFACPECAKKKRK